MSTRVSRGFRLAWGFWVLIGLALLTLLLFLASQGLTPKG
jgi:hypothetical protein